MLCVFLFLQGVPALAAAHPFVVFTPNLVAVVEEIGDWDCDDRYSFKPAQTACAVGSCKADPDKSEYLRALARSIRESWDDRDAPEDLPPVYLNIHEGRIELIPQRLSLMHLPFCLKDEHLHLSRARREFARSVDDPGQRANLKKYLDRLKAELAAADKKDADWIDDNLNQYRESVLPQLVKDRNLSMELVANALSSVSDLPPQDLQAVIHFDFCNPSPRCLAWAGSSWEIASDGTKEMKPPPPIELPRSYVDMLTHKIKANYTGAKACRAVRKNAEAAFTVRRDGTISNLRLERSSGNVGFDDCALKSIEASLPFFPLPPYPPSAAEFRITFDTDRHVLHPGRIGAYHVAIETPDAVYLADTNKGALFSRLEKASVTPVPLKASKPAADPAPAFDSASYMDKLTSRIKRTWAGACKTAVVGFTLNSQGQLSGLRIISSSGETVTDSRALNAVRIAAPFRKLPAGGPATCNIEFTFHGNEKLHGNEKRLVRSFVEFLP
jgi:TonB family protein